MSRRKHPQPPCLDEIRKVIWSARISQKLEKFRDHETDNERQRSVEICKRASRGWRHQGYGKADAAAPARTPEERPSSLGEDRTWLHGGAPQRYGTTADERIFATTEDK